jgi:predicted RNA-binding protein with PUA-like domain
MAKKSARKKSSEKKPAATKVAKPTPSAPSNDRTHWLVKTEPDSWSVDDFLKAPKKTTHWDGVRNYQARNMLRDEMKVGHEVLIYHSNAEPPSIVGLAVVAREGYPDPSSWDKSSHYYDEGTSSDNVRWYMVDLQLKEKFKTPIPLPQLRDDKSLTGMELLRKGSRLSVQCVSTEHFEHILKLASTR